MKKRKFNKVLIGIISIIGLTLVTGCSSNSDSTTIINEQKTSSIKMDKLDTASENPTNEQFVVQEYVSDTGATFKLKVPNLEQNQLDFLADVVYPTIEESVIKYDITNVEIQTVELDKDSEGLLEGIVRTIATNEQGTTDQTLSIQDNKVVLYYDGSFNSIE